MAVLEMQVAAQNASNEKILKELQGIRAELTRYKGFIGGISFVISGVVVVVGLAKGWILGVGR